MRGAECRVAGIITRRQDHGRRNVWTLPIALVPAVRAIDRERQSCKVPVSRRASLSVSKGLTMATKALAFDVGDYVVYPKHGVGRVVELQNEEIAGMKLQLYVLRFEKERMTLRVPVNKVEAIGMRKLSSDKTLREALDTLKGKPKVKRTMWSRRAQEYEAKINSGDLVSIAEVTRDLFRADDQPEQSYSERQIFEAASSRLARELAAMEKTDEPTALKKILAILNEHAPKYYETATA
jgi:CarD family transcriptional regulator